MHVTILLIQSFDQIAFFAVFLLFDMLTSNLHVETKRISF